LYVEYPTLHNIYRINFKDSFGSKSFRCHRGFSGIDRFCQIRRAQLLQRYYGRYTS
jgi:hypothetical protein